MATFWCSILKPGHPLWAWTHESLPPAKSRSLWRRPLVQETTTLTVPVSYQKKNKMAEAIWEKGVKHGDLFIMNKLWSIFFERSWWRKPVRRSLRTENWTIWTFIWMAGIPSQGRLFPKHKKGDVLTSKIAFLEAWETMVGLVGEGIGESHWNLQLRGLPGQRTLCCCCC